MHYKIEQAQNYLRAGLSDRKTAEETQEFIRALAAKAAESGFARVLVCVHNSRPIYKRQSYGITEYFRQVAANPAYCVAVLSDSEEMRSSQQYIEMLARERGAKALIPREAIEEADAAGRAGFGAHRHALGQ